MSTTHELSLEQVIAEQERVVAEKPDNVMARHQLGLIYRKAGRMDDALRELEKAVALDPQSLESLINLGALYFDRGDEDRALQLNRQVVDIYPEMAEAHGNIGLILQRQGLMSQMRGDEETARASFDVALAAYRRALQLDPKMLTAWINLTSALTMTGQAEEAVASAQKAVELAPDSPMARNNLAVAFYFLGSFVEADRAMQQARELGYEVDPRFASALQEKLASS